MRSLIDILDLSVDEITSLIQVADDIIANPEAYADKCRGKKLATLFFEPSTRTRLSFEAAMYLSLIHISLHKSRAPVWDWDRHCGRTAGGSYGIRVGHALSN